MPRIQGNAGRPSLACQRCRKRKIKCDLQTPQCGHCRKARTDCLPSQADINGRRIQGPIQALESRLAQLKGDYTSALSPTELGTEVADEPSPATLRISALGVPETVAPEHYRTLTLTRIITAALSIWTEKELPFADHRCQVQTSLASIKPAQAHEYLNCYRLGIHSGLPFVDIDACQNNIDTALSSSINVLDTVTLMVLAIGALTQDNSSLERSCHVVFCANAARQNMAQVTSKESIETLQLLLLLTIFSLYDPCGGSSWHLVGLSLQVAIALGLHQIPQDHIQASSGFGERAFWCAYVLDRAVSVALDNPCGISDDDITSPMNLQESPETQHLSRLYLLAQTVSQPRQTTLDIGSLPSELLHMASSQKTNEGQNCRIGNLLACHLISWSLGPPLSASQQQPPPAVLHQKKYIDLVGQLHAQGVRLPWITAYSLTHGFLLNILLEHVVLGEWSQSDSTIHDQIRTSALLALARQFPSIQPLAELVEGGLPSPRLDVENGKTARLLGSLNALMQT